MPSPKQGPLAQRRGAKGKQKNGANNPAEATARDAAAAAAKERQAAHERAAETAAHGLDADAEEEEARGLPSRWRS